MPYRAWEPVGTVVAMATPPGRVGHPNLVVAAGSPESVFHRRIDERSALLRAAVLLMGASFFAYLFAVSVHEVGHYLAKIVIGDPERVFVLHPFDLSYSSQGGVVSEVWGTPWRRAFAGAGGPLLNVVLGGTVSLAVWRRRSARWLPVLMWGPVALAQEGVGLVIGLVDYPNVRSDWVKVMVAGVPVLVIGGLALVVLVAGFMWFQLLVPLLGIWAEDPRRRLLVVLPAGIPLLMLGAVIYLTLAGSNAAEGTGYVLQNRTIALGASLGFMAAVVALYRPMFPILDRISHTTPAALAWRDAVPAISLAAAVVATQLAFFN